MSGAGSELGNVNPHRFSFPVRGWSWTWVWLGVALVIVGFAGVDRWFYEHVSKVLDVQDRPLHRDFYATTRPFWLLCRYAFGHGLVALGVCVYLLLKTPRRIHEVAVAVMSVLAVAVFINMMQGAIGRLRPNQAESHFAFVELFSQVFTKQGVSFPSGEAATAFAIACVMTRLVPRWRFVWYVAAAVASAARLVNGAHYVSDVAAGAIAGYLLTAVAYDRLIIWERRSWRAARDAGVVAEPAE